MAAVLFIKKKSLTEWTFLCFPSRVMCLMWAVNASKQGSCGKCFREQDMTDEAGVAEIEGDYTIWHCPADSDSPSILKWKWAGEWVDCQPAALCFAACLVGCFHCKDLGVTCPPESLPYSHSAGAPFYGMVFILCMAPVFFPPLMCTQFVPLWCLEWQ